MKCGRVRMTACVANKKAVFGCHFIYIYIYIYVHIIHINCTKHCIDICVHFGHLFSFSITYIDLRPFFSFSLSRSLAIMNVWLVNSAHCTPELTWPAPGELSLITCFFDCSRIDSWLFTLSIFYISLNLDQNVMYHFVGIPRQSSLIVRSSQHWGR